MPFILLALVVLAGIGYGAVRLYAAVALRFGTLAAVATIGAWCRCPIARWRNAGRRYFVWRGRTSFEVAWVA
ncbi:hypothetical protein [Pandoraea vervacti]|uniref:hypothetical protein n=1 Tax=Pandoraea vervacti TaxID=656178 RepID=UPI0012F4C7CB|nr:hypothetical protein [Pandoraea vervacti]